MIGGALGFIGAGKVGSALARRLSGGGYDVRAVYDRDASAATRLARSIKSCGAVSGPQKVADGADLVFITTPDDAIITACASVRWKSGHLVVHCSGVHSTDVLASAAAHGAVVGSFHPCQAFADAEQAFENISGSTFAIEAAQPLDGILKEMAEDLGCDSIRLDGDDKALYHAAAVFVSNYVVTLLATAAGFLGEMGIPRERAVRILMPLMKGNISNIDRSGLPDGLTGPIARGDSGTVEKHIRTLLERSPENLLLYTLLGFHTVPLAEERGGVSTGTAALLKNILTKASNLSQECR